MPTDNHDLPIPGEDESYADGFQTVIEELDRKLLLAGPLEERPEASEELAGLWFLDIEGQENDDAETVLYACRHTGEWEIVDLPVATDLSTVPQTDDHFTVTATWAGRGDGQQWVADITGAASYADETESAVTATEAALIDGLDGSEFATADAEETITRPWHYTAPQTFEDGVSCTGGVIGLPSYTDDQ